MNEKIFKRLFPKVKLSLCPHKIQNFGNSVTDISILGQFCTYLQFRGEKYLNTFIVTNANNCSNLLSHGATFRMGVLLPNYPEENVVKGQNVPNFKINTSTGTSSNVFQILQDLLLKQRPAPFPYHAHRLGKSTLYHAKAVQWTVPFQYHAQYCTSSIQRTVPFQYCAHRFKKINDRGRAHSTTDDFFQDHHTLHSYDWKNDNKTSQSSTCTSRNSM